MRHPPREQQELHVLRAAVPERGSPQGESQVASPAGQASRLKVRDGREHVCL